MEIEKTAYCKHLFEKVPLNYTFLCEDLDTLFNDEYEFVFSSINSDIRAQKLLDYYQIPNATASDYKLKKIDCGNFYVLAHIRFKGMQRNAPFVSIEYISESHSVFYENIEAVKPKILEAFSVFDTHLVRLLINPNDIKYLHSYENDISMLAVAFKDFQHFEIPKMEIEVVPCMNEMEYEQYCAEYEAFLQKNENLRGNVLPEPIDVLNSKAEKGYLCKILYENQCAGWIALDENYEFFVKGYVVWDKIIYEPFQGMNLSYAALSKIIRIKEFSKEEFLHGWIDPTNFASYNSALKSGRTEVLMSVFL
jgi:hypothetical protein